MARKEEGQESCFLLTHYGMQSIAVITSLQTLLRRKATGEKGPATELEPGTYVHSYAELQPHKLSVPVTDPSSPIALCTDATEHRH